MLRQAGSSSSGSMIRDGDKLLCNESLFETFLIAASYAFGRLCLRPPPLLSELVRGFS